MPRFAPGALIGNDQLRIQRDVCSDESAVPENISKNAQMMDVLNTSPAQPGI